MCTINANHMMYGSWDMKHDKQNCYFGLFFAILPPWQPEKPKFWKIEKNSWRYYHFTLVNHKWQSNNVWFLRYWAWQTYSFCHFGPFFALLPPNNPKYQNFEKIEKTLGYIIILYMCAHVYDISGTIHYMTVIIISCMVPEISSVTDRILCHFGHFLPIYPLKTRKIKILEK